MLGKIIGTVVTKFSVAITGMLILILNANNLGAEGVGEIALIILGIAIIQLLNNFVGGPALVYLVPKKNLVSLILPSYIWAIISSAMGWPILYYLKLVSEKYIIDVVILNLIFSIHSINMFILLGKEKIKIHNIISLLQNLLLLTFITVFFYISDLKEVNSYINALYFTFSAILLLSSISILRCIIKTEIKYSIVSINDILRYGTMMQFANILQLLTTRLNIYFLDFFSGRAIVGIFSAGNQISEGLLLIGKSVGMVEYSKISNLKNLNEAKQIALSLSKFTVLLTFILLIILTIIPENFYIYILGERFAHVKLVILTIAVGILSLTLSNVLSHYFSGVGKHYQNTICSGIGFIFTLTFGLMLIPKIGIAGAGITASISYTASVIYQLLVFMKINKVVISDFYFKKADIMNIKSEIERFFNFANQKLKQ